MKQPMQSTVQITGEDQRQCYFNAIITKISDLKRYYGELGMSDARTSNEVEKLIHQARSFKNLFNVKNATITLTRSDVDLLTRILDTSA